MIKLAGTMVCALLVVCAPSASAQTTTTAATTDTGDETESSTLEAVRSALTRGQTDPAAARVMLSSLTLHDDVDVGRVHAALAKLAMQQHDTEQAERDLKAGLAALGPGGDARPRQKLVALRATVAKAAGDDERALRFALVSTSMARKLDEPDLLRRALVKEGKYLTATSPDKARARLQEARALATGDPDETAEIDALVAALPTPSEDETTAATTTTTTTTDAVVWGLGWGELIPLALPLLYGVLMLVTARRRRSVLAQYPTKAVLGLSARSLIPVYGQANLVGWRRALSRHRDDASLPSMSGTYGADGVTTTLAIWGPLFVVAVALMVAFAADNDALQAAAAAALLGMVASTLVLEPLLHHVRDTYNVLPCLQPMRVVRLLRHHPLQCLEVVVSFGLNNLVLMIGNTWWVFGGTIATTVGAASQAEALRRFNASVLERDAERDRAQRGATSVGGNTTVVPTFDTSA